MTLGSHQTSIGASQSMDSQRPRRLRPRSVRRRSVPWDCAHTSYTARGLDREWYGRTWLNPPFHRYEVAHWVQKLAQHGHGTALLHARTEAEWFEPVWEKATAILFLADRLYFHYPDGRRAEANSGAPACLIAFGEHDARALRQSGIAGYLISKWEAVP